MSFAIDEIVDSIVSRKIDKQEALRSFDMLSEADRNQLVSGLRMRLGEKDLPGAKDGATMDRRRPLVPVHERNLDDQHKKFIQELSLALAIFAPRSKENASKYQPCFVDQRKTGGLKKSLKPLQFHLTYDRGEGPYLYDIDGNKYVDIAGDNGVNLFGHQPEFIKRAIEGRLHKGYPLVGYTEELFSAATLFCEITGHERVLFTQSGTEAVMWACRIARAATQKKKIVVFDGAFHGLSDTVLVGKDQFGNSIAMGLGMLQEFADQLIVLDYGKMDQLDIIEERCDEIAGVLVEPVQSRNPSNQPAEFLQELRKLTLEKELPLIFDEMITGFRVCSRGAQRHFGIKADIATYGKIPGGGMPTGMIAGSAKYMNFVDGGPFNYGDDNSMPSLRKSLMAGTHTRHPLKIAATLAALTEIKRICPGGEACDSSTCLLHRLNEKTARMAEELNAFCLEKRIPLAIDYFSSLFRFRFLEDPFGVVRELFLILLRMNGVETSPSGNNFLTVTHSDEDFAAIVAGVKASVLTLLKENFFHEAALTEAVEPKAGPAEEKIRATVREVQEVQETVRLEAPKARVAKAKAPKAGRLADSQIETLKNLLKHDLKQLEGSTTL